MEYRITDANAAHVAALDELEKQCFSVPWTREQLLSQLPDGRHEFLVALAEGAPAQGHGGIAVVFGPIQISLNFFPVIYFLEGKSFHWCTGH